MTRNFKIAVAGFAATMAAPAFAHPGSAAHGLVDGLAHPLSGADHLLAMVAVGLWASTRARARSWQAPAAFLVALVAGALVGAAAGVAGAVEPFVMASLLAFSVMVMFARRVPDSVGLTAIGFFALFHGFAHGSEAVGDLPAYFAGFLAMSAGLHLSGYLVGTRMLASRAGRFAVGAGVGIAGLAMSLS